MILFEAIGKARGKKGWDVSEAYSAASMKCLKNKELEFGIVRAYHSYGAVDQNACNTLNNAKNAGYKYLDIYMFPCVKNCPNKSPETQVNEMIEGMAGCPYNMIWLDLEIFEWYSSHQLNIQFTEKLVAQLLKLGENIGIYSSIYMWETLYGLQYKGLGKYPLWYAHYDGKADFSDFKAFGGWYKPSIKQFRGGYTICEIDIDENFAN